MSQLPTLNAKELVRILKQIGFRAVRQRGSHLFLQHPDGRTTLVSMHRNEDIGRGLLRQILREIELSPDEFLKLLQ